MKNFLITTSPEAEAHLRHQPYEIDGIKFGAVKDDLISARQRAQQGNLRAAILHMKWAVEKLLPDGQQYCSQTLSDDDPDKTIQGYLDNIVDVLRAEKCSWRCQLALRKEKGFHVLNTSFHESDAGAAYEAGRLTGELYKAHGRENVAIELSLNGVRSVF
jgi:hypothetical protein